MSTRHYAQHVDMTSRVRVAIIGCGGMARWHIREMARQQDTTAITVICEPSEEQYQCSLQVFREAGIEPPPNQPDLQRLLSDYAGQLDAAFIITPHAYHHDQAVACMDAGLDVLLEKPMVVNAAQARSLIATRDRTARLLVVAFPGSLSPQIHLAVRTGALPNPCPPEVGLRMVQLWDAIKASAAQNGQPVRCQ